MRFRAIVVAMALAASPVAGQDATACELVDQASAEVVLGSGARNLADAEGSCRYDAADGSLVMMVLIQPLVLYDVSPISPALPVDIGDRGRHGVGSSGSAHVQFAKGQSSVTIRVTPIEGGGPANDLMDAVLEIARIAADRMN